MTHSWLLWRTCHAPWLWFFDYYDDWHICDYVMNLSLTATLILRLLKQLTHLCLLWQTCHSWQLWFCEYYNSWHICDYCNETVTHCNFDFGTTMMIDTFMISVMNLSHVVTLILWLLWLTHLLLSWWTCHSQQLWFWDYCDDWHICNYCD